MPLQGHVLSSCFAAAPAKHVMCRPRRPLAAQHSAVRPSHVRTDTRARRMTEAGATGGVDWKRQTLVDAVRKGWQRPGPVTQWHHHFDFVASLQLAPKSRPASHCHGGGALARARARRPGRPCPGYGPFHLGMPVASRLHSVVCVHNSLAPAVPSFCCYGKVKETRVVTCLCRLPTRRPGFPACLLVTQPGYRAASGVST